MCVCVCVCVCVLRLRFIEVWFIVVWFLKDGIFSYDSDIICILMQLFSPLMYGIQVLVCNEYIGLLLSWSQQLVE